MVKGFNNEYQNNFSDHHQATLRHISNSRMTTWKVFELPEEYLMELKSEIIIIDTTCDSLSNELYEISIKKFLLFIMNYQSFTEELTLIF